MTRRAVMTLSAMVRAVRVQQVHLVLAGGALVVRRLDGDAHLAEVEDGLTPQVGGDVAWGLVEVAATVDGGGVFGALEVEGTLMSGPT